MALDILFSVSFQCLLKMGTKLVDVTPRITEAVSLINDLDDTKFPLILSRILQNLHVKDERCFTEDEETKLQTTLSLSRDNLLLVLETLSFIFEQVAYYISKPLVLQQQLTQLGLNEEKVNAVVGTWTTGAKNVVDKLRQRTLAPRQLDTIHWKLNLEMAQARQAKLKNPTAVFDLGIHDENKKSTDELRLEFNHDELYEFYSQLERVQVQLDSLR